MEHGRDEYEMVIDLCVRSERDCKSPKNSESAKGPCKTL